MPQFAMVPGLSAVAGWMDDVADGRSVARLSPKSRVWVVAHRFHAARGQVRGISPDLASRYDGNLGAGRWGYDSPAAGAAAAA